MITINLLSPDHKEELRIRRILISAKEIVALVLLFTSIVAIMLVTSRYFLENQLSKLIISNQSQIERHNQINKQITAINKKINDIAKIQKGFKSWSAPIRKVAGISSADISFQTWQMTENEKKMSISGTANSREMLIKFKKQLEETGLFSAVELPLGDLLAKTGNRFNITAQFIQIEDL